MLSFLTRRLLQTIPTVLAVVLLVFVLFSVVPGSIVTGMSDDADPQVELRMKKQLGLDDPSTCVSGPTLPSSPPAISARRSGPASP